MKGSKNKYKGDLTQLKCMLSFMENEVAVSVPYGDNTRYDFIIDVNDKLYKVQCKTSRKIEEGVYELSTSSNNWQTKKRYTYENDVDFFVTYIRENCYLIPIDKVVNKNNFRMRFIHTRSNQIKKVNFAKDYLLENVLKTL